ncbi:MAG: TOBE domain-containing protein [Thermodesulfobacteriota bacterium]
MAKQTNAQQADSLSVTGRSNHARILTVPKSDRFLDVIQLGKLEQSFRNWAENAKRGDVRRSRRRILLIFLLIRYTGAKLNEVLALNPFQDIDFKRHKIVLGSPSAGRDRGRREVQISKILSEDIQTSLGEPAFKKSLKNLFNVDPGHVRRKFYERAAACGFPKALGAPDAIRKSRAVELMQSNMPLPAVQRILGHSTPNLTTAYVSFSDDDIRDVTRHFMERESRLKTSARNTFFGKIRAIRRGDIQAVVELATIGGDLVTTVITNDSLSRLGLKEGTLITAEVKAPWVMLFRGDGEPDISADNRFRGVVDRIAAGAVNTEYVVRIADGTELCSLVTSESGRRLDLHVNDAVWAVFTGFSVVLHID